MCCVWRSANACKDRLPGPMIFACRDQRCPASAQTAHCMREMSRIGDKLGHQCFPGAFELQTPRKPGRILKGCSEGACATFQAFVVRKWLCTQFVIWLVLSKPEGFSRFHTLHHCTVAVCHGLVDPGVHYSLSTVAHRHRQLVVSVNIGVLEEQHCAPSAFENPCSLFEQSQISAALISCSIVQQLCRRVWTIIWT